MTTNKLLLTTREVAELTGFSEGTLRHWTSEGRLPTLRLSARCVRFRREDIERWLAELVVEPTVPGEARPVRVRRGNTKKDSE